MLTDVYINQLTALSWIVSQFEAHVQYVNVSQLTSPGVPASQLDAQGFIDMDQSKDFAKVAADGSLVLLGRGWRAFAAKQQKIGAAHGRPGLRFA